VSGCCDRYLSMEQCVGTVTLVPNGVLRPIFECERCVGTVI